MPMPHEVFEELLASVRRGGAVVPGEMVPPRTTRIDDDAIQALRRNTLPDPPP
jgi:hypothetical protein